MQSTKNKLPIVAIGVLAFWGLLVAGAYLSHRSSGTPKRISPTLTCKSADARDQDDMCVWVHPEDSDRSTVVTSDKKADKVFVYDLQGENIQSLPVRHPGNIDVRYNFPLAGRLVDIVALNGPKDSGIVIFQVDPVSRQLERVDNGRTHTATTSGGTLYHSLKSGKFYYVTTSKKGEMDQYELADDGAGKIGGTKVRSWHLDAGVAPVASDPPKSHALADDAEADDDGEPENPSVLKKARPSAEGAVADDESGKLYISEERRGVWEFDAEPNASTKGELIIKVGEHGLIGDIEGLALYDLPDGDNYLVVSDQGSNDFKVYQRAAPHHFSGAFAVDGALRTDGIDICNASLGSQFPTGLFLCHSAADGRPVLGSRWDAVAQSIGQPQAINTHWKYREMTHSPGKISPRSAACY